jgi:prepilin-type N-terminal cleavage/methylation domain-containing protein
MNVQRKQNQKGFTIIEVVLVLAIAGLIFLMVFIALPALQRNQRDTQRKNDLSRAQTAINNFQTNNRNKLPTDAQFTSGAAAGFRTSYLTTGADTFSDPNGNNYVFAADTTPPRAGAAVPAYDGTVDTPIYFARGFVCDGENVTAAGTQKVALRMKLEGGGVACVNN